MSRESFVLLTGLVVFFMPYIGIPTRYKEYIFLGTGALLMLVGYSLRRSAFLRSLEDEHGERRSDAFVEYKGKRETAVELEE